MRGISMAVNKTAAAIRDGPEDILGTHHGGNRLVATAEPLGERHDIGNDAFLFASQKAAGPAGAAHHLIQDEEDFVSGHISPGFF